MEPCDASQVPGESRGPGRRHARPHVDGRVSDRDAKDIRRATDLTPKAWGGGDGETTKAHPTVKAAREKVRVVGQGRPTTCTPEPPRHGPLLGAPGAAPASPANSGRPPKARTTTHRTRKGSGRKGTDLGFRDVA